MGAGCSLFEIAVNKEERFLIGGNNVFAGGSSPLALGWPHNKSTCLSHTALYFSLFILMEANKTPASNEHSQSSFFTGWEVGKACFLLSMKAHSPIATPVIPRICVVALLPL